MCQIDLKKQLSFLLHRSTDPGDTDVVIDNVMEDGSTGQYVFYLHCFDSLNQMVLLFAFDHGLVSLFAYETIMVFNEEKISAFTGTK